MAKVLCCVHDTQMVNTQASAIVAVSIEGGLQFGTDVIIDFAKSMVQMNQDLRSKIAFIVSSSFNTPTVANDVILCGAFS